MLVIKNILVITLLSDCCQSTCWALRLQQCYHAKMCKVCVKFLC